MNRSSYTTLLIIYENHTTFQSAEHKQRNQCNVINDCSRQQRDNSTPNYKLSINKAEYIK